MLFLYENMHPPFADVRYFPCPVDVEKQINNKTRAIFFCSYGGRVGKLEKIIEIL
jgi:dTDP-4-amino-4,6-dideoxygalactose transaminase